jgi:hypothetical protein
LAEKISKVGRLPELEATNSFARKMNQLAQVKLPKLEDLIQPARIVKVDVHIDEIRIKIGKIRSNSP